MPRILIAEDDRQLNEGIRMSLQGDDREFMQSYTVAETKRFIEKESPDLVILDINFPDGSGLSLLKEIRQQDMKVRIILLTANHMESDIVVGLESGADDYITKPFSLMVLRARVNVQLRKESAQVMEDGDFSFDFEKMLFRVKGQRIELSRTEQKLLRVLLENRGRTVPRELLIDRIWDGDGEYVDGHALTVNVKRLRQKLGEDTANPRHIQSVYGIGYRWEG